jgi:TPR repeat protein
MRLSVVLLLLSPFICTAQDFDAGMRAFQHGDYAGAIKAWRPLAEAGNKFAQANLGALYDNGQGTPRDSVEAVRWYRAAAEQGVVQSQFNLGCMYQQGDGVPHDDSEAAKWFRKAADQGDADAQVNLGGLYQVGRGVPRDDAEGVRWFRLAAEKGNAAAQHNLGLAYEHGGVVERDDAEAARWYVLAAEQGFAASQYRLGLIFQNGQGTPKDLREAARWLQKAAGQGNVDAAFSLAEALRSLHRDMEAVQWYRVAGEKGHVQAQLALGQGYWLGWGGEWKNGVPQSADAAEAVKWFRMAANQGDPEGQSWLAQMYAWGTGVSKDLVEAAKWYRKAADQGYASAEYDLARLYESGEGLPQDLAEAAKWYRKAAEAGHIQAQAYLGSLYRTGKGLGKDYSEALKWLHRAVDRNLPPGSAESFMQLDAKVELGVMCELGEGVPANNQTASYYYQEAADQGHSRAQVRLAHLYSEGKGVSQDYVQAYMWLNLAAARGESIAEEMRGYVASKMTANQIASAQDMTRSWKPKERPADRAPVTSPAETVVNGSGFVVSRRGHIVTNHHVVNHCSIVAVQIQGMAQRAIVLVTDQQNDLALLKISEPAPGESVLETATFADERGIRPGQSVVAVGFPLVGLLSSAPKVTTGTISALAGIRDDSRMLQITAPVQPGNSGGPVLDDSGNIVGVVTSKLDALEMALATGDIPQNVNFAIKASVVRAFLDANSAPYATASRSVKLDPATIGERAARYTALIECRR